MPNNNNGSIDFEARLRLDQLDSDLQRLRDKFSQTTQQATKDVERFQSTLNNAAKGALAFFTLQGAQSFAREIFNVRSQFQQLEISFTTMLKSKEKANALTGEMVDLADKSPLGLRDISEGAKRLLAFKVPAEEVNETLRRMGDIASGLGVPIGQLIHVYGQVKAQGRLMTNDLYQFMNAEIPIIDELSKITGKTQSEIKEMVSQGKIGFTEIQQVIKNMTDSGGLFHNLMAEQSKTLGGQLSNLRDNVEGMLNELGKASEGAFSGAISGVNFLVEHYREIGKILSVLIATYGTYRTALMAQAVAQQVVTRYGQYDIVTKQLQMRATIQAMLAQIKLNTAMLANPYVLVGAAIVGLVVAIWQFSDGMSAAEKAQKKFNEEQKRQSDLIQKEREEINKLIDVVKDETQTKGERNLAFLKLKELYPNIFSQYKTEEELLKNIAVAQRDLNKAMDEGKLKMDKDYVNRLKIEIEGLKISKKGSSSIAEINRINKELDAKGLELEKATKNYNWSNTLYKEKIISNKTAEERQKEYDLLIEEYNRRHNKKINANQSVEKQGSKKDIRKTKLAPFQSTGYEDMTDADLGYLIAQSKKMNEVDSERNKIIHDRVQLQKEVADLDKKIKAIQNQKTQSQTDNDNLKKYKEEKEAKEKILKDNFSVESSKKSTSKAEKPTFDKEAFDLQTQRQARDIELQEQRKSVEKMAEGYEKERALIQLHYDEKEEAILRGQQDALRALEKEYKDSKGLMSQSQYEARKSAINDMAKTSHNYNLQAQETANNKLIESLLKSYQDFEDKKTEILEEYAQKRALLEESINKETDPKKIAQFKRSLDVLNKEEAKALNEINLNRIQASKAFKDLFSDFELLSKDELNRMVEESALMIEQVRKNLDFTGEDGKKNLEFLKTITDQFEKLRKTAQGGFFANISNVIKGFKKLLNEETTPEEKRAVGISVQDSVGEIQESAEQIATIFDKLGDDLESSLMKSFAQITRGLQEGMKGINEAIRISSQQGGATASDKAGAIMQGVAFVANMISEISANRRARRAQERQEAIEKIQMQEDYNLALNEELRLRTELSSSGMTSQYVNRIKDGLKSLHNATENQQKKIRELIEKGKIKNGSRNKTDWNAVGKFALAGAGAGAGIGAAVGSVVPIVGTAIGAAIGAVAGAIGGLFKKKRKQEWTGILAEFPELIKRGENGLLNVNKALLDSMKKNNQLNDETLRIVENIEQWNKQIEEAKKQIEGVVDEIVNGLGDNIRNNLVDSFKAGEDAVNSLRKTFSSLVEDMTSKILMDVLFEPAFKKFKEEASKSYDIGGDQTLVDDIGELFKTVVKQREVFNEELRQAREVGKREDLDLFSQDSSKKEQARGFASMTQDQASELNAKFTLGLELDRVRNISLEKIQTLTQDINANFKFLQDNSAKQLRHLQGIESNTYMLHNIDKEVSGMKGILSDIQLKGLKMK